MLTFSAIYWVYQYLHSENEDKMSTLEGTALHTLENLIKNQTTNNNSFFMYIKLIAVCELIPLDNVLGLLYRSDINAKWVNHKKIPYFNMTFLSAILGSCT